MMSTPLENKQERAACRGGKGFDQLHEDTPPKASAHGQARVLSASPLGAHVLQPLFLLPELSVKSALFPRRWGTGLGTNRRLHRTSCSPRSAQLLGASQTTRSSYFCNYHTHPPPLSESGRRPRLTKYSLFFPLRSPMWGNVCLLSDHLSARRGHSRRHRPLRGRRRAMRPCASPGCSLSTDQGARL